MRIAVLIVGILGALGAGTLGVIWMASVPEAEEMFRTMTGKDISDVLAGNVTYPPGTNAQEVEAGLNEYIRMKRAIWFLFGAFALGIGGAILAFTGRHYDGAILLFAAFLGPLVLAPITAVFTFLLLIAGGLAFFVKPPGVAEPRRRRRRDYDEEDDEEEYEERPRRPARSRRRRRRRDEDDDDDED